MAAPATRPAAAYGVIYAEEFDDLAPQHAPVPPEPVAIEPRFTLAELEAIRAAALDEGAAAERGRLDAAGVAARANALQAIAAALVEAGEAARIAAEEAAEGLAQAVLSVVAAGLPALCTRHGEGEVHALLRSLLPTLAAEPAITVRLNPHLLDPVRADLAAGLDPEIAAAVQLVPADAMPPGDVRVSWEGGSCQRSAAAACAAVGEALALLGLRLPGPPPLEPLSTAQRPDPTRILEAADVR
jgi:flagellar biosynthesis/type III secretory pathway protein FliH